MRLLLLLLATLSSGCSSLLYYPTRALYINASKLPVSPTEVAFHEDSSRDEKLVAWHFSAKEDNRAILLVFHGNAQNISSHFQTMYWAVTEGLDLFIFDYPGYGGSLGSPNPENTVDAGKKALAYVQKTWPKKKVIVVGQSLGGAIALRTLIETENKTSVCAAIIDSSFDSYQKVAQEILSETWWTWPLQWLPYLLLSDRHAPYGQINRISPIPLLVLHRQQDPVVPPVMSRRIFSQAAEPKKLLPLPGKGHVNSFTSTDRVETRREFLNFVQSCME